METVFISGKTKQKEIKGWVNSTAASTTAAARKPPHRPQEPKPAFIWVSESLLSQKKKREKKKLFN